MRSLFGIVGLGLMGCTADEGPLGVNEVGTTWVEVYNGNDSSSSLEGWTLEVDGTTLEIDTIDVGGGEVVELTVQDFAVAAEGSIVIVRDSAGELVQDISVPVLEANTSYGRLPDGAANWQLIDQPSPGALNGSGE